MEAIEGLVMTLAMVTALFLQFSALNGINKVNRVLNQQSKVEYRVGKSSVTSPSRHRHGRADKKAKALSGKEATRKKRRFIDEVERYGNQHNTMTLKSEMTGKTMQRGTLIQL